jgi:hypothetical protein
MYRQTIKKNGHEMGRAFKFSVEISRSGGEILLRNCSEYTETV